MGRSPRCYIPGFIEIDPQVPVEKIFEGHFTIYGLGGHLGHGTSIISTNFISMYLVSSHTKLN